MKQFVKFIPVLFALFLFACGSGGDKDTASDEGSANEPVESMVADEVDPMEAIGVGPITSLDLPETVDADKAANGETIFKEKCLACHRTDTKFIGPPVKGILERRSPEWVMNMILNPDEMVQKDPLAKKLLQEFNGSPMANQNLTEEEARSVLEYFRTL